jgi:hypothetical protein
MIASYDLGGYAAPALRATRLVPQGLPDDGKGRAVRSDFLNSAVGSCQPLPGPRIWRGLGWGASSQAHPGSGELVTGPDVHVIHRIRWPEPVRVMFSQCDRSAGIPLGEEPVQHLGDAVSCSSWCRQRVGLSQAPFRAGA